MMITSNTIHRAALPSNELPSTGLTSAGFDSTQQCWIATQSSAQAYHISGFLVSKETVVLRRWGRSKQKFGFIKRVDKC